MGYHRAGFRVVGVDIKPQPRYPFTFVQGDAIEILAMLIQGGSIRAKRKYFYLSDFSAIHASPPCQAFTKCQVIRNYNHPNYINALRDLLRQTGKPYIIENVPGAPLINPVMLAGTMFNLGTVRKRLFECSFEMPFFLLPMPGARHAKMGRLAKPGEYVYVAGKGGARGVSQQWKEAMGIDWMTIRELAEAIPPAYTEFIGRYLLSVLPANKVFQPTTDRA